MNLLSVNCLPHHIMYSVKLSTSTVCTCIVHKKKYIKENRKLTVRFTYKTEFDGNIIEKIIIGIHQN